MSLKTSTPKHKKLDMFARAGFRCEKSTAFFLKEQGFDRGLSPLRRPLNIWKQ